MSSEPKKREDFLAEQLYRQWIVHCAICGRYGRIGASPIRELPPKFQELFPVLTMSPDGVCQVCLPQYNYRKEEEAVRDVLHDYVKQHGCPCNWAQFEYWVSKEQGPGWHDTYQNVLVEESLRLSCFEQSAATSRLDTFITCQVCGRRWRYVSEEWRMMAYRNRLIPDQSRVALNSDLIGSWFATAGLEPIGKRVLSIDQWKSYMFAGEA
jgi:hypothetical protein